jgi:hypothetical protein
MMTESKFEWKIRISLNLKETESYVYINYYIINYIINIIIIL